MNTCHTLKRETEDINPIKDKPNKWAGTKVHGTVREKDGSTKPVSNIGKIHPDFGQRYNVWDIPPQRQKGEGKHPAPFPEQLANDHILSWSNPGDLVFDPFIGSGTTAKMAVANGRKFLGFDLSEEYCKLAKSRVNQYIIEHNLQDSYNEIA